MTLKQAYEKGFQDALKESGLKEKLMPLALTGGLMGGGAAIDAARRAPPPITKTMVQKPTMNEMPNFGNALNKRTNDLDAILGSR